MIETEKLSTFFSNRNDNIQGLPLHPPWCFFVFCSIGAAAEQLTTLLEMNHTVNSSIFNALDRTFSISNQNTPALF